MPRRPPGAGFLLEHLPPQVHLVIATRADPPLPLARLRAAATRRAPRRRPAVYTRRGRRISQRGDGARPPAEDVAALEARTEGWIAALQLAALSMQGRDDVAGFIAGFAGDDRYIVDYLVEEVLQRQPEHVRSFLLQTSILDRLSGPLCDAVTGQDGGKAMLEALERATCSWSRSTTGASGIAITISLPTCCRRTCWTSSPTRYPSCTGGRASGTSGTAAAEAIRHALAGEDFERAADLVELAMPAMRSGRQDGRCWAGWRRSRRMIRVRPVLSVTMPRCY